MAVITAFKLFEKWGKIPTRLSIAVMLFMSCLVSYMMRVNLSINIIAMVDSHSENATLPDFGPRYNWSQQEQSYLLGAYFYGYMVTSLPAGVIAAYLGGRNVVGYSIIMSAALTVLQPFAAAWNFWSLFVLRFLIGVLGGFLYPALHHLISKWSPPTEKGKFVSALMGGTFGTVITWPLCGIITETLGYSAAFYFTAITSAIIALIWFYVVADTPSQHPRIEKGEQEHIENSLADVLTSVSKCPPVKDLVISLPFWSLLTLHYGNMWGLYFLLTAAPKFMGEVLGFNIAGAGVLSSLPHLARLIFAIIFGQIGDSIKRRKVMNTTFIRKFFTIFSHFLPGLLLVVMAFFGRDAYVCVALMTLSLGLNGAASITNLQNSQDLAPNYAGTLYGIINFFGTTPGFFSPMIVAYFTKYENTIKEWVFVFLTGAGAYIIPASIFLLLGSGEVQYWNSGSKDDMECMGDLESKEDKDRKD